MSLLDCVEVRLYLLSYSIIKQITEYTFSSRAYVEREGERKTERNKNRVSGWAEVMENGGACGL